MAAIDVGSEATDRGSGFNNGNTLIDFNNPANLSGKITSVEIFPAIINMTGIRVAVFTDNGSGSFTSTDSEALADITSAVKTTRTVDLDITAGQYIGIYYSGGRISYQSTGGGGAYYFLSADKTTTDTTTTFTLEASDIMSIKGIGATVGPEFQTQVISVG